MNNLPPVLLCSRDPELTRRVPALLGSLTAVRIVEQVEALDEVIEIAGDPVLVFDARGTDPHLHLPRLKEIWPRLPIIVLAEPRSEPALLAESLQVFAVDDCNVDQRRLLTYVQRALDHVRLLREVDELRANPPPPAGYALAAPPRERERGQAHLPLQHFSQTLRHFDRVDTLIDNVVESVASAIKVTRVGLFCRTREDENYRLRSSLRCLDSTTKLEFAPRDPLAHWLRMHAHLVSRATLEHIRAPTERHLLRMSLDSMGAEVLIPLHARGKLLGWLFVGHRVTGVPFDVGDLEDLSVLGDHVSGTLENAMLYEEVAVQKTLAETLLQSMPSGIVAVAADGTVRWFSSSAQTLLDVSPEKVLNKPLAGLGSRLSDLLHRTLRNELFDQPVEWVDPLSHRHLSVQTYRLMNSDACLGAMAIVHDLTMQRMLEEKQEQLERAAFWTELAASMSHEIRNPLVAIKTFAQLLPERYSDTEFRAEFSRLVSQEVDRLNRIIEQINQFAHPPELRFHPLDIRSTVHRAIQAARLRFERSAVQVETALADTLPDVLGDDQALSECLAHLITNAMEAAEKQERPKVTVTARAMTDTNGQENVMISVQDNGKGIHPDIREKVFSPFCTTKARGMGLGLPIAKRTVVDHNGRIFVDTGDRGTCVSVFLPSHMSEVTHEEHTGRRR